jgi:hypothetical protein
VGELGRESWFGPLTSLTLAALSPNPPLFVQPPPIPLPLWPPPPLPSPPFSSTCSHTPNPSPPPPSPPPKVSFVAARIYVAWCKSSTVFGGGRKERGRTQGDFCVYLLFICAAIQLFRCCVCDWVEGLSRILRGGRTAAVLVVSGHFSWRINGNQFMNHVELWHTFPTSIYALNLEL